MSTEGEQEEVTPRPCSKQPALILPVTVVFSYSGAQPSSSERMLLLCRGTTRILSWHYIQQWHRRRAPARLRGTHRSTVLCLTENHRLRFLCLGFQRKLPAHSPRLWDETAELQTSCHFFQQNPRGRKIKQISFPQ